MARLRSRSGDVVWFPPGEKHHWHGASAATAMSHVAIQESLNGTAEEDSPHEQPVGIRLIATDAADLTNRRHHLAASERICGLGRQEF
jgi:hypothetical protein